MSYFIRSAARRAAVQYPGIVTPAGFAIGTIACVGAVFLLLVVVWLASIAISVGQ